MVKVKCTAANCDYETADVGEALALELYKTHRTDVHPQPGGFLSTNFNLNELS